MQPADTGEIEHQPTPLLLQLERANHLLGASEIEITLQYDQGDGVTDILLDVSLTPCLPERDRRPGCMQLFLVAKPQDNRPAIRRMASAPPIAAAPLNTPR